MEETRISQDTSSEFLNRLADDVLDGIAGCMGKGWQKWVEGTPSNKFNPEENEEVERAVKVLIIAVQTGLLIAQRQPELVDFLLGDLESTGGSVDELWRSVMWAYEGFLEISCYEYSEKNKVNPDHFVEFLSFIAITWLREMSKYMDKEWQKGWDKTKTEARHRFKTEETARIKRVGNYAVLAILTGVLIAKRQPDLLNLDWSWGSPLDPLWESIMLKYVNFLYFKTFVE